jgi:hypothetical protein
LAAPLRLRLRSAAIHSQLKQKKMNTFEFRRRTHYTQKGILPNGMQELQKISLEAMMRAERENSIHQKGI